MADQGWFKVYRELWDKAIWTTSTSDQKVVLLTLLKMANHRANEWEWQGEKFVVQPGQMITSTKSIAKASGKGITVQKVKTSLKRFEKYEFLTNKSTKTGRLITIDNWGIYQGGDEKLTKSSTVDQPSTNHHLTTNKNDKKDKKKEEGDSGRKIDYQKIINYLNEQTGQNFRNVDGNRSLIRARINEGYSEHDFALVISVKAQQWNNTPDMVNYLRPKTLFSKTHFDEYRNEALRAQRKQQRPTPEPQGLTPEEGSARSADYMAKLEEKYKRGGI